MVSSPYDTDPKSRNTGNTYPPNESSSPAYLPSQNQIGDGVPQVYCDAVPYSQGGVAAPPPPRPASDQYAHALEVPQVWSPSNPNQDFPQLRQSIPIIPYTSPALSHSAPHLQPPVSSMPPVPGVAMPPPRHYEGLSNENHDMSARSYYEQYYVPSYVMSNPYASRSVAQLYEPPDSHDPRWSERSAAPGLSRSAAAEEKVESMETLADPRAMDEYAHVHANFSIPGYGGDYDRPQFPPGMHGIPSMSGVGGINSNPSVEASMAAHSNVMTERYEPSYRKPRGSMGTVAPPFPGPSSSSMPSSRLCGMGEISTSVDHAGIPWLEFQYPREGTKHRYRIRCDIDDLDVSQMDIQFRVDNCIYPGAMAPPEEYRGHRRNYETECNFIGWKLVFKNPVLQHKRGLIQRAVDTYRNSSRNVSIRSRRARRLAKLHRLKDKSTRK